MLDDSPSRTAEEVATGASDMFPTLGGRIHAAARLFDAVLYGHRPVDRDAYERLVRLDDELATTRPLRDTTAGDGPDDPLGVVPLAAATTDGRVAP